MGRGGEDVVPTANSQGLLSALDSPEDIRLGKMLGADDYLTKPINEDDLLATIAGKIKRSKKRDGHNNITNS